MAGIDQYFKSRINIKKGISGTGDLYGSRIEREKRPTTFLEVGDIAVKDRRKDEIIKQFRSPIAYDIWYLKHFVNMLSSDSKKTDSISQEYLDENLNFLEEKLKGIKPLLFLRDLDSLVRNEYDYWVSQGSPRWTAEGEYFINLLAYENWFPKMAAQFDSSGPEKKYGFNRDDAVGYLAFPVGQLGVMEVVSILKESALEVEDFDLTEEEQPILESTSEFLFSPADQYTGKNKCFGEHIIESGYIIPEDNDTKDQPNKRLNIEYLQTTWIPPSQYADIRPQYWLRYWINKEEKFPVPGEFIGILVKPLALPPHIWWFQRSSPYIHAGNWVETNNLTSGVVVEITKEADRTDGGVGDQYKIKLQGYNILIDTSDFMEYNIGDRVGVLKVPSVKEEPAIISFKYADMTLLEDKDKDKKNVDYIILPIDFYKDEN